MQTMQSYKQITCNNVFLCTEKQAIYVLKHNSIYLLLLAKPLNDKNQNDSLTLTDKEIAAAWDLKESKWEALMNL